MYEVAVSRAQTWVILPEKIHMVVPDFDNIRIAEIWRRGEIYSLVNEFITKKRTSNNIIVGKHIVS